MLAPIDKKAVYNAVNAHLDKQIEEIDDLINRFQEAANGEVKNTAGDKHEVSKAQMQWEVEKASRQKGNMVNMKGILIRIDPSEEHQVIAAGSLVKTDQGFFYIGVSLGKVTVEHEPVMAMSSVTPLAQLLLGKRKGDEIEFNDKKYVIDSVH